MSEIIEYLENSCPNCKKEIFATHQRFYRVVGASVGAVAYEMTNDLPTQGLDVSNAYFHLIYPTLNGTSGIPIGPQLTDYFANVQNGILWSNIAGVQAVIDFVLPSMGLSVGDVIYAINTTNLPIFLLSPTAVAELANNTFLHIYWGSVDTHNNYNEKADVNVIAANPNILLGGENKCVGIQEIKEKDTCTGEETYRYVIEDLNGNLVKVDSIYPDFVEADVLLQCPIPSTPTIEDWELLEVELLDDVANDGTGLIIPYSELYAVERDGTRALIATVDNKGANYTLLGTRRVANEIGVLAKTKTNQFLLNGAGIWSPLETMVSFSYSVISVGNVNNPPTFTGTNNIPVPIFAGENVFYDVIDGTEKFDISNVRITSNSGDVIKIIYTQI